ncbi:MAG: type II toxin-antitoxin system VapC family toxin [Candidatus Cloacimonetes bacterium]|nr:type II toxin-antitoxin system VapC family toxin [Candidatus Cloacimonadota bacterium]
MKQVMIDTDILSLFFRGNEKVKEHFEEYLNEFEMINISIITYYEILSGLKYRDSKKILTSFLEFAEQNKIISLTLESIDISSNIYSILRKQGNPLDDIDLLIAGIAISNDMIFVTHNTKHFNRIENLIIADWTL